VAPFSFKERHPVDVKQYYRKKREIESTLIDPFVLVVSLETPDGGRAGVISEVSREAAAKLLVEGSAVLASDQEKQSYLENQANAKKIAHKAELARRLQVAIIADSDIDKIATGKTTNSPGSQK